MCLPNVILAGVPKCGTTSVFDWLSDHPEVCASSEKETLYFMDEEHARKEANYIHHGMERYHNYFAHCKHMNAKVILEASPGYIYQHTALEVLPQLKPCPKILFVLRKPSERVYSVYKFLSNNIGTLDMNVSFNKFVRMYKDDTNVRFKGLESMRTAIERSIYVKYIPGWIERFGEENVYVLLFEHMRDNSLEFMKKISSFIGIDDTFWDHYSFSVKNVSYRVKRQNIHRSGRMISNIVPEVLKERLFKRIYYSFNTKKLQARSTEDSRALEILDREFLPYNRELSNTLKIDLSAWG